MKAYEVSNYAEAGQESRHNLSYWRGESYLGVGPGAHGRFDLESGRRCATETIKSPERWLESVEVKGHGVLERVTLTEEEVLEERLLMGLRLQEGVILSDGLRSIMNFTKFERLMADGYLVQRNDVFAVSEKGRLVLNAIVGMLVA